MRAEEDRRFDLLGETRRTTQAIISDGSGFVHGYQDGIKPDDM